MKYHYDLTKYSQYTTKQPQPVLYGGESRQEGDESGSEGGCVYHSWHNGGSCQSIWPLDHGNRTTDSRGVSAYIWLGHYSVGGVYL